MCVIFDRVFDTKNDGLFHLNLRRSTRFSIPRTPLHFYPVTRGYKDSAIIPSRGPFYTLKKPLQNDPLTSAKSVGFLGRNRHKKPTTSPVI
jgi:hypothetical protein